MEIRGLWRSAGFAGLLFVAIVVVQNLVRGATAPLNDVKSEVIAGYFTQQDATIWLLLGSFGLTFPLILLFAIGVRSFASRTGPVAEAWGTLGVGAGVMVCTLFGAHNGVLAALHANAPTLASDLTATRLVWDVNSAIFWINTGAVGLALIALSRAASLAELGPRWGGTLGAIGGSIMIVGSVAPTAFTKGAPAMAAFLVGFLCWLVWVGATGLALARAESPSSAAPV